MAHHYDDGPDIRATNERIRKIEEEKSRLEKEKQNILEKEEIKNQKALDLSAELQSLKEQRDKINGEIFQKQLKLNKLCTHEKIRTENRNYPGSYLDKSEHWTDYFCEICGVKVDEKVTYGSFG